MKQKLIYLFILLILAGCKEPKNNNAQIRTSYIEVVRMMQDRDNETVVIAKADSCLNHIKTDTSIYCIGLNMVKGIMYGRLKDSLNTYTYLNMTLDLYTKKINLSEIRDPNDILNRACILIMLGRKDEALEYIKSFEFTAKELEPFGDIDPVQLVYDYQVDIYNM